MAKRIAAEYTKGNPLFLVHPDQIICESGENSRRYTSDDVNTLAQSIKDVGQLQAVGVSRTDDGKLKLEWGYRRYRAVQLLNEKAVEGEGPYLLKAELQNNGEPVSDVEAFLRNIAENAVRREYSPADYAHSIGRLTDELGMTMKEAGAQYGRSAAWASSMKKLLELPASILRKVDSGAIPVSACYDALTMPEGPERDTAFAALEASDSISRSEMKQKVRDKAAESDAQDVANADEANAAKDQKKKAGDKKKRTLKELTIVFETIRDKYTEEDDGKENLLPPAQIMVEILKLAGGGKEKTFERRLIDILG